MILLVLAVMVVALEPALVLFAFFLMYSLSGYVRYGWRKWKGLETAVAQTAADGADDVADRRE